LGALRGEGLSGASTKFHIESTRLAMPPQIHSGSSSLL
jgi:hypothetical protein